MLPVQLAHVPASAPHALLAVPIWQAWLAAQHPAQVTLSHLQAPPTQCSPKPHGWLPVPQVQTPLALQVSALSGSQAMHDEPLGPQVAGARGWQSWPSQQPWQLPEHGGAPQAPASQVPEPQDTHAVPPVPQLVEVVPGTQTPLAQQPEGQLVESQVATAQPPS